MANKNPIYNGLPENFWVVTKPWSKLSTLVDICFESSIPGMIRQQIGGLDWADVLGIHAENQPYTIRTCSLFALFESSCRNSFI